MRKVLIFWLAFLVVLLFMTSCKSKSAILEKEIVKDSITAVTAKEIIVTARDTTLTTAKDSSYYSAKIEADSNGKVFIKEINDVKAGRNLHAPKVTIKDNQLNVDCVGEAEKLFFSWKEKFVKVFKENFTKSYKENQKPIIVNQLTWWQKTQIYVGRFLFCILILLALLRYFKFYKF